MDKENVIYIYLLTMDYYSVLKNKGIGLNYASNCPEEFYSSTEMPQGFPKKV